MEAMGYTVKQVAGLSGISVRTMHFYDELGLLKPTHVSVSGYRYYEEPQLRTLLQQVFFYPRLGFKFKQIKRILGRADFEKTAALESHRSVLKRLAHSGPIAFRQCLTRRRLEGNWSV
jgi:DNA-binding transcriptional MerR regulator